jgi:hypothetical protein
MNEHSFTTGFSVDSTPLAAFEAITNVRGWWSDEIEGGTAARDDEFTYHFQDLHRCRIRVTEAVPGRKVSWLVLDNHFDFTVDQTEWVNTRITFEISTKDGRTEVRFTHHGLVEKHECFGVCSNAWSFYVNSSLRDLITTGAGQPNSDGHAHVPEALAAGH